jgi:hypothetical protein
MARRITASNELGKLRDNQKHLVLALQTAFDLLEDYAPLWYTKKYRDLLANTLARVDAREPNNPAKVDKGFSGKRKRYAGAGNSG